MTKLTVNREKVVFIEFIANNLPGLAYSLFNKPCDFMVCYNKYPEVFATVSIIQYKRFHMIYDNSNILQYINPKGTGMFGNNLLSPMRGTSFVKAERLIQNSQIIRRLAGSVIESEPDYQESNLIETSEWNF